MADILAGVRSLRFGDVVECGTCGCILMNNKAVVKKHSEWHEKNDLPS